MSNAKTITIFGSTGSIGKSTVDILERNPELYKIKALTANANVELLAEQAKKLNAEMAITADDSKYTELKDALSGTNIKVAAGRQSVIDAAELDADWTMSSIVGAAGLEPTMAAIKKGKTVALANKETLVCAGGLVMQAVKDYNATLIPVDSEHSAIFQVFDFEQIEQIDRILLTASGGPFREKDIAFMEKATPEQAVAHPNWSMGAKISVDSASMMNKGLELIEAYHLFGLPQEQIEIIVHPQSVIHSAVAYKDGSVLAQLGSPDMRTPIAYALGWPKRIVAPSPKLDLIKFASLTFIAPDEIRFPALRLAREALKSGGVMTAIMNAANEVAVDSFLKKRIAFTDIAKVVEKVMNKSQNRTVTTIEEVIDVDNKSRQLATDIINM